MIGFYVAASVVTLMQYLRVRERRLLPLLALFTFLAIGHYRGEWDGWGRGFHFAAGGAGLVLMLMLSPQRHPHPK